MTPQIKPVFFILSAISLLAGTVFYLTQWAFSPYLFAVGAAGLSICYATEPYQELNLRARRLQRYNLIASVLMIGASALMFKGETEWILCLSISALLQLYTAFVMPKAKEENK